MKIYERKYFWVFIGFIIHLIVIFCIGFNWGIIFGYGCYEDKAILHNQRVGELKGCCDNCLIFNVTEFVCKGQPGDGCGCEWKNRMLYFSGEQQERTDLKNSSEILVNWCWIKEIKDYRVRGVKIAD